MAGQKRHGTLRDVLAFQPWADVRGTVGALRAMGLDPEDAEDVAHVLRCDIGPATPDWPKTWRAFREGSSFPDIPARTALAYIVAGIIRNVQDGRAPDAADPIVAGEKSETVRKRRQRERARMLAALRVALLSGEPSRSSVAKMADRTRVRAIAAELEDAAAVRDGVPLRTAQRRRQRRSAA